MCFLLSEYDNMQPDHPAAGTCLAAVHPTR